MKFAVQEHATDGTYFVDIYDDSQPNFMRFEHKTMDEIDEIVFSYPLPVVQIFPGQQGREKVFA